MIFKAAIFPVNTFQTHMNLNWKLYLIPLHGVPAGIHSKYRGLIFSPLKESPAAGVSRKAQQNSLTEQNIVVFACLLLCQ